MIKCTAIRDDRHRLGHLQRSDLGVALADGKISDIAVQNSAAVGDLHVLIVRNAPFDLAANRDSAFRTKSELEGPIDNRLRTGLDADLVEPGVARFCQRLDKIEGATVAFFPIVKSDIADLN